MSIMNFSFQKLIKIKSGLSKKKIFRKSNKKLSKIIIDFSLDKEDFLNYLNIYKILIKLDISIPKIYEIHFQKKIIVIEDFGDDTFNKLYNNKNLYELLKLGVDNLIIIQNSFSRANLKDLSKYSYSDLKLEISEFVDYYIPYKKILNFPEKEFYECWRSIYNRNNFEFNCFVHKDYEFINLMFLNERKHHLKCGIIDFQSAFLGFVGWDLFSILEDPRLDFSNKYNDYLMKYFYESVNMNIDFKTFTRQYFIFSVARLTRLLGRWIKLYSINNQIIYFDYINVTKKRLLNCLDNIDNNKLKLIYENFIKNHE